MQLRRKDGSPVWVLFEAALISGGDGAPMVQATMVDITRRKQAEETLKKSEEKFSKAFRQSPLAITLTSAKDHRYLDVNETFEQLTGWRRDEVIGRTPFDIGIWVEPAERLQFVQRLFAEGAIRDFEVRYRRKNGEQRVGLGSGDLIEGGDESCVLSVIADITDRKRSEEALSAMSRKLIEAQEQERARIGRDLHDDVVQRLALLAIELERVQQNLPDSASVLLTRVGEIRKRTLEISTSVQTMSHELHSSKLEYLGIVATARSFCKEFAEQSRVEIDFKSDDVPTPLPPEISLCLFRVLQESLHNAAKHSGVGHFEVRLWGTSREIHLAVSDLGEGFDKETALKGSGLGLTSMQERLKLVNGELSIESQPRRGTTIHARAPLSSASDAERAVG
jgi:PAS domain S-box-containing protein